ncbi:hypothetical protein KC333_g138 [Hortaea werneckii]|nr:hypothetical protein KC333_g138 [Hortaea werneckii]
MRGVSSCSSLSVLPAFSVRQSTSLVQQHEVRHGRWGRNYLVGYRSLTIVDRLEPALMVSRPELRGLAAATSTKLQVYIKPSPPPDAVPIKMTCQWRAGSGGNRIHEVVALDHSAGPFDRPARGGRAAGIIIFHLEAASPLCQATCTTSIAWCGRACSVTTVAKVELVREAIVLVRRLPMRA